MNTIDEIINIIQAYKEDNPQVVITDDMIKEVIEDRINDLINEIKEEL